MPIIYFDPVPKINISVPTQQKALLQTITVILISPELF